MKSCHIAIIDPSIKRPEIEGFNLLVGLSKIRLSYHLPAMFGFESLYSTEKNLKGIVVMGSFSSVNDRLKWQDELISFLFKKIKKKIPVFGICFGHQLLSFMFGGKIGLMDRSAIGFNNVEIFPNRLLKKIKRGKLFASHSEEVKTCPKDMVVIGRREKVLYEALSHKFFPIWSVQSHPEVTPTFVKRRNIFKYSMTDFEFGYSILKAFFNYCSNI